MLELVQVVRGGRRKWGGGVILDNKTNVCIRNEGIMKEEISRAMRTRCVNNKRVLFILLIYENQNYTKVPGNND